MTIVRNPDGSLEVPIPEARHHDVADAPDASTGDEVSAATAPTTRVLHPGEGGYNEALAEWDLEQNPDIETGFAYGAGGTADKIVGVEGFPAIFGTFAGIGVRKQRDRRDAQGQSLFRGGNDEID